MVDRINDFSKIDTNMQHDNKPPVSKGSHLTGVFQKNVVSNVKSDPVEKNTHYTPLNNKSTSRRIILLIPFIGKVIVGIYDFATRINANKNQSSQLNTEKTRWNNKDEVLDAVRKNGMALQFVNKKSYMHRDIDVVQAAVKQNGLALQFADAVRKNDLETVIIAVKQNGLALQFVSKKYFLHRNKDVVEAAVKQNGLALQFTDKFRKDDLSIVSAAVKQNPDAIKFASKRVQNRLNAEQQRVYRKWI